MPKISHKGKIIKRSSNLSFKSKAKKQKGGGEFGPIIHNFHPLFIEFCESIDNYSYLNFIQEVSNILCAKDVSDTLVKDDEELKIKTTQKADTTESFNFKEQEQKKAKELEKIVNEIKQAYESCKDKMEDEDLFNTLNGLIKKLKEFQNSYIGQEIELNQVDDKKSKSEGKNVYKTQKRQQLSGLFDSLFQAAPMAVMPFPPRGSCLYKDDELDLIISCVHLSGGRYDEQYLNSPFHKAKTQQMIDIVQKSTEIARREPDIILGDFNGNFDYPKKPRDGLSIWKNQILFTPEERRNGVPDKNIQEYFIGPHTYLDNLNYSNDRNLTTGNHMNASDGFNANKVDWIYFKNLQRTNNGTLSDFFQNNLLDTMCFYKNVAPPGSQFILKLDLNSFNDDNDTAAESLYESAQGQKYALLKENSYVQYRDPQFGFTYLDLFRNPSGGPTNPAYTYLYMLHLLNTNTEVQKYIYKRTGFKADTIIQSAKNKYAFSDYNSLNREVRSFVDATDHQPVYSTFKKDGNTFTIATFNVQFYLLNIYVMRNIIEQLARRGVDYIVVQESWYCDTHSQNLNVYVRFPHGEEGDEIINEDNEIYFTKESADKYIKSASDKGTPFPEEKKQKILNKLTKHAENAEKLHPAGRSRCIPKTIKFLTEDLFQPYDRVTQVKCELKATPKDLNEDEELRLKEVSNKCFLSNAIYKLNKEKAGQLLPKPQYDPQIENSVSKSQCSYTDTTPDNFENETEPPLDGTIVTPTVVLKYMEHAPVKVLSNGIILKRKIKQVDGGKKSHRRSSVAHKKSTGSHKSAIAKLFQASTKNVSKIPAKKSLKVVKVKSGRKA